jgi:hypothetical protein
MADAVTMAENLGRDNGKAAAGWTFDGNTPDDTYRTVQRMMDEGDPAIDSVVTEPSFGDGYSVRDMMDALEFDYDATPTAETDQLADAYSDAARDAFWDEVAAMITRHFGVVSYRCPCCGDDVMDTGPVCEGCRDAGCEKTRDGTGEVNYWRCQQHS